MRVTVEEHPLALRGPPFVDYSSQWCLHQVLRFYPLVLLLGRSTTPIIQVLVENILIELEREVYLKKYNLYS